MKLIDWIDRQPAHVGFGYGGARSAGTAGAAAFASRTEIAATAIADPYLTHIRTEGYGTPGDGGGALHVRAGAEPSHPGKIRSADGTWWEYVPGPEGTNVRAFGAVGDGLADDGAAVADAWNHAVSQSTRAAGPPGGAALYMPAGDYLITGNNVFGAPGGTGQFFWPRLHGAGRGATIVRFRPGTGTSVHGDDKYYLFDGGDGTTTSDFKPLRISVEDMLVYLEDDNLAPGDELWFWRSDGTGGQQNLHVHRCQVEGPGPMTAGHVRTGALDIVGSTNASENRFDHCYFRGLSHLARSVNDQAKDLVFVECDAWLIHDHFLVCDNGALAWRIFGGSWIWPDTADADVSPQFLLTVDSSGGSNPGLGNMKFSAFGMETEMRGDQAALIGAGDAGGAVFASFSHCSFTGGNVEAGIDRDVTVLHQNKVVVFDVCNIPGNFGFSFVAPNGSLGDTRWARPSMGQVILRDCALNGDLSEKVSTVGAAGRVVATGCYDTSGTAEATPMPRDFDSNPFNGGVTDPPPAVRTASGIPEQSLWTGAKTYQLTLPYGARLKHVTCYRPPSGDTTVRTMTLADGDGVLASVSGPENGGLSIDYDPGPASLTAPRTTGNGRTLSLSVDAAGAGVTGGLLLVEWI